jgi:hypothetical protein
MFCFICSGNFQFGFWKTEVKSKLKKKAAYLVLYIQLSRQISLQEGAKNTSRSALHIFNNKKPFIIVVN